jgi:polysaccharide deacetylase family protein (PEP-CTERM system associated)
LEKDVFMMVNALTIDVEDYFHVSNFERHIPRSRWGIMPLRVETSTMKVLELLSNYKIKATFFVLGWIAERISPLIRDIRSEGHEIASHGYDHRLAYEMDADDFRNDVRVSKSIIEDTIGEQIYGFRATSYSIVRNNLSYLQILAEEGFLYDSSIYPVYHDRYGISDWDRFTRIVRYDGCAIYEVPPSTFRVFGYNLPIGGGGYLRLFPARFLSYCINQINTLEGMPAVIYFHPWELDADQPRIKVPFVKAFRHYNNLHAAEGKVDYLLRNFNFCKISEILGINAESLT